MDKLLIIINCIFIVFMIIANITYFKEELKKKSTKSIEVESKEVIINKIKKELNTHGIVIMYLCSVFVILLLDFKNSLNTKPLIQAMYIAGGVQSIFFLIKKDFNKVSLIFRVVAVVIISCIEGLLT